VKFGTSQKTFDFEKVSNDFKIDHHPYKVSLLILIKGQKTFFEMHVKVSFLFVSYILLNISFLKKRKRVRHNADLKN
jgi:hypothetical protein